MPYIKAEEVLPPELLRELQKYIRGSLVYVPAPGDSKLGWGARSGARESFDRRNAAIKAAKMKGAGIEELAEAHCLSSDAIRKILYASDGARG